VAAHAHKVTSRAHAESRALGWAVLGLSGASLACIGLGLPWQIRFPIVMLALLLGPGVPLLLLRSQLSAPMSVVAGLGVDVALLMLVAEGMVLTHTWRPSFAVSALLMLSAVVSARLLATSVKPRGGPKCAA
jgi:hypothetical protein